MPARGTVRRLQKLASSSICSSILDRFHSLVGADDVAAWAPHLNLLLAQHLQTNLYQELVEQLLLRLDLAVSASPSLRPAVRQLVPALLGPQLRHLDFTWLRLVGDKSMVKQLYAALHTCTSLETLAMGQSFFFLPELVADLGAKLSCLPKLVSLKLHYIATDCMLIDLGRHCPKLLELSLKGSGKVGDESVEDIATCSKLRLLDIQGTQITGNGLLEIIGKCPQLSWVRSLVFLGWKIHL